MNQRRYFDPPEDISGTIFDPYDPTFGPIMAELQAGKYRRALGLLMNLIARVEDAEDESAH